MNKNTSNQTTLINAISAIAFAAITFFLMAIDGGNYLRKIDSLSIFLPTCDFARECLMAAGGPLCWVARWLTQSFYYPWLGATVYCVLLLVMAVLTVKAFKLSWRLFPVVLIPPTMTLLSLLKFGYLIISLKTPGFAFLMPVGIICCLLLFWAYSRLQTWWLRLISIILIAVIGYECIGFYGLLATAMCVVAELCKAFGEKKEPIWQGVLNAFVALVLIAAVPKIWFENIGGRLIDEKIYIVQLPLFKDNEQMLWITYIIAFITMLAFATSGLKRFKDMSFSRMPKLVGYVPFVVGILAMASVYLFRYDDANFRLTLDIDRALQNSEWQEAVEIGEAMPEEPTRLSVFMRYVALLRTGEAADRMFKSNVGGVMPNTTRDMRATHDMGATMLTYHLGMINYAYRWAMEYNVEYGMNVESLKFLAKCALINKEYNLAKKYLDILSLTTFHKDWAERFEKYVANPKLMEEEPEIAPILKTLDNEEEFIFDKGQLEGYVWPRLAAANHGSADLQELSMIAALVCRDMDSFVRKMPSYVVRHERVPIHFQEAILMWSYANNNNAYQQCKVDKFTEQRFQEFVKLSGSISNMSEEEQREALKPMFGDTYWYYLIHVSGMKII